jgi:hypothetical protein
MNKPTLAARRAALIAECAEQRAGLADAVLALRPVNAIGHPLAGFVVGNKKLVLGAAATTLGLLLTRPRRLLGFAGTALSGWKTVRGLLQAIKR